MVFFARGTSLGQLRTLLGREISCSQWEGPSMHSRCLAFFPFNFGEKERLGGRGVFPLSSNGFPIMVSKCSSSSQCVPQHVLCSTSLSSHMLWQLVSSFFTYIAAPKSMNSILQNRTFYFGEPP
jgi:hypothetical protein